MDMSQMLAELQSAGRKNEASFIALSDIFPQLLAVRENIRPGGLAQKLSGMERECGSLGALSGDFWAGRNETYAPMLEKLNERVAALSSLDRDVSVIRECSEAMQLLSLNAMVISIKSGARGRAFSSITESLRGLSSRMIENSSRLVRAQDSLVGSIKSLENVIAGLSESHKEELGICRGGHKGMKEILSAIGRPIPEIEAKAGEVWQYIAKSMETIQMQDIVKQAAAQVLLCLKEFKDHSALPEGDIPRRNDTIAFDIQLCKIALEILRDISSRLEECIKVFSGDWDSLTSVLEAVEKMRVGYINSFYMDLEGQPSLSRRLAETLKEFEKILDGFFHYISAQKSLVRDCMAIKAHSRGIFIVFADLLPVVNSLQHVRVLQKIEIAKNDAISEVRNSASDMDTYIGRSKDTIDGMSRVLEGFLSETDKLLTDFVSEIAETGEVAAELKEAGAEFFARLKEAQAELEKTLRAYMVFPKGFGKQCAAVREHLAAIVSASEAYMRLSEELARKAGELEALQGEELKKEGLSSWELEDGAFKKIISRFTIALHKELAGGITGVEVESGAAAGEVTFFDGDIGLPQ